jgi:hypothetical protein
LSNKHKQLEQIIIWQWAPAAERAKLIFTPHIFVKKKLNQKNNEIIIATLK